MIDGDIGFVELTTHKPREVTYKKRVNKYLSSGARRGGEGGGRFEDRSWRGGLHDDEAAKVAFTLGVVVQRQLVCNQVQDPALTGAQVLGEDHVVFGGIASEHEQAVIKRKRLSVIQIQLVQVCYDIQVNVSTRQEEKHT